MKIGLIAAVAALTFATPALADFWIVQDSGTKKCTIVEQRPTTTTTTIVGGNKVFKTRTEAESEMKTVEVCKSR
jgi:hypothetical protein